MKMISTLFQKPEDNVVRILGGKETGFPVSWAVHGLWEVPVSSQGLVPRGAAESIPHQFTVALGRLAIFMFSTAHF